MGPGEDATITYKGREATDDPTVITVVVTPEDTENYNTVTVEFTVNEIHKVEPTHVVSNPNLTYNGAPQQLGFVTTNGGTVTYSLDEDGPYSTEVPTQTNAGTYTVYYKIAESTNYNPYVGEFSTIISRKDVTITLETQHSEFPEIVTYTFESDGDGTFRVESANPNIALATIEGKTITLTPKAVGTVTITVYHDAKSANGN